ncbi:MAG: drug/metabolite exporter YedA [Chloroflexota bacterium]|nr:drug/metabolite exporter YedA [Chloroflexota bacterium]
MKSLPLQSAKVGQPLPWDVLAALFAVYVVWGSTYLAIRVALISLPPFFLMGSRFVVAGLCMYFFLRARGAPTPARVQWLHATIIGALLLGGGMDFVAFAEQWITSGLTAVSVATMPIWTALFLGLWGQSPTRMEWTGIVIGFLGVGLLSLEGNLRANPTGAVALLIAPICWSFGSALSRKLTLAPGAMGTASEMMMGGLVLFLISWLRGEALTTPLVAEAAWAWLYLVVFGSLIAFTAYMFLLERVRPALATSYAYVNPVIAVLLGVFLAGEQITTAGYVAMVVVLVGIGFITLGRERVQKA